jgi:hypothetical protein
VSISLINIGTAPLGADGDSSRTASGKINANFQHLDSTKANTADLTAVNNGALTLATSGTGLSGSASFTANQSTASTFTVASNATNLNTAGTLVARDGSGNFTAGTITATTFSGSLGTAVTFNNSGSGAASGTTYNGSTARTISFNTVGAAATSHSHVIGDLPVAASGVSSATEVVRADDSRLSNARTPTSHVLATTSALGAEHSVSGLTAGQVLRASGATTAAFATLAAADVTGAVANTRAINTQHSVTGGGDLTADRTLSLVGDTATPGNSKVYGTDASGVRGWKDDPAGGATGGSTDQIFWENDTVVTTNYTVTTAKNAMTAGPITINSGVTVTVPTGSSWTVV